MTIPKALKKAINDKQSKDFSSSLLLETIADILNEKKDASIETLYSVVQVLYTIDTDLAQEFAKIYTNSPILKTDMVAKTMPSMQKSSSDWKEEDLSNYNPKKFVRQKNVQLIIDRVKKEQEKAELLKKHDLEPMSKLLFDGKSGVGKTESAREIAYQMGLPLYVLDLATIYDSKLGATGAKLKSVIEFAISRKCVFLLDEFDSVASARNTIMNDSGETKRVVNVLLKLIESWKSESILICATNHIEAIDKAMMRRFDAHVKFELPNTDEIKQIINYKFRKLNINDTSRKRLLESFKGKSHSVIINKCETLIKNSILDEECINRIINNSIEFEK